MLFLDKEFLIYCDVDDTLVMHGGKSNITIVDPYDKTNKVKLRKHQRHIDLLKRYSKRGFGIVVWSNGGAKWAKAVVEALNLTDHVDMVTTKPNKVIDDLELDQILSCRVYLNENGALEAKGNK